MELKEAALKDMEQWHEEEKQIATRKNQMYRGMPWIRVVVDGGWGKISHGHSYNSTSGKFLCRLICTITVTRLIIPLGVAVVIGAETKKVLQVIPKNSSCIACTRHIKHDNCHLNHHRSAGSMEATGLVEAFSIASVKYGVYYMEYGVWGEEYHEAKLVPISKDLLMSLGQHYSFPDVIDASLPEVPSVRPRSTVVPVEPMQDVRHTINERDGKASERVGRRNAATPTTTSTSGYSRHEVSGSSRVGTRDKRRSTASLTSSTSGNSRHEVSASYRDRTRDGKRYEPYHRDDRHREEGHHRHWMKMELDCSLSTLEMARWQ